MKLTEYERTLIAKRAHGSYAIIPAMRRIMVTHRKNRNPDDAVFIEFAVLVLKKSFSWDDYERLARAVLEVIPEPFGTPFWKLPPKEEEVEAPPPKRKKRTVTCGICGETGHNARGCPDKPDTSTVKHTDGVVRLSPGFDPNPPSEVEEGKEST